MAEDGDKAAASAGEAGGGGGGKEGGEEEKSVKLFVGQVPKHMTEADLLAMFREVAAVDEVTVIRDRATRVSRGPDPYASLPPSTSRRSCPWLPALRRSRRQHAFLATAMGQCCSKGDGEAGAAAEAAPKAQAPSRGASANNDRPSSSSAAAPAFHRSSAISDDQRNNINWALELVSSPSTAHLCSGS